MQKTTVNSSMQCYSTMWRLKEWLTLGAEQDLTICRTGSLAEGRSSVSAQTRTQTSLLSVLQHCPWHVPPAVLPSWDTGTLPFLPLHHLHQGNSFPRFLHLHLSSEQSPLHCSVDVLVQDRDENSSLGGTCCCLTHHCSSGFAGTGSAHRRLGTMLCSHGSLVISWR